MSNLTANIGKVTHSALDLLFPRHCLGCRREGRLLCPDCSAGLPRLEPPYCAVCAQPGSTGRLGRCRWCSETSQTIDGIRSPFLMEGVVQEAVHRLLYENRPHEPSRFPRHLWSLNYSRDAANHTLEPRSGG